MTDETVPRTDGYTQTFRPAGRKLCVTEATGRAANYSYDATYRLLNETISSDPKAANYEFTSGPYRFDAINFGLGLVAELKPGSSTGFLQGKRQLKCYVDYLNQPPPCQHK